MAQAACRFEKVSKSYRTGFFSRALPVLTEVSFEVQRGETFAYLGHNGAGKTTTIKALLGLIRLTAGTVEVLGHAPGAPAALARIGYVPENPMFYDHLSGRELLQMVADLHRLPRSEGRRRIDELLELVDMQDRADRRMKGYSKGMRQRIGLAQALINDPELVVLDEPMGGLDPMGRAQIRGILQQLRALGKTLFLSSHILADVEAVADRAAIVSGGRLRRVVDVAHLDAAASTMSIDCRDLPETSRVELERAGAEILRDHEISRVLVPQPEALPAMLERVQSSGARLLQVVPRRASLEDVFLAEVGDGRAAGPRDVEDVLHFLGKRSEVDDPSAPVEVSR